MTLDPGSTALLVTDYQVGVVSQMPDQDALLERVNDAIAATRARGAQVGWVRVALEQDELNAIPSTSVFATMLASPERRAAFLADAPATQIDARLAPAADDIVVRKIRVGAFTTTDLDTQLRARGIDTVVLAGLSTSGVVLSTVREAMDRDYRIVVLRDACGDRDDATHTFLTETIFPRYATVIDVGELDALWV